MFCYVSAQNCILSFENYPSASYFTFTAIITTNFSQCFELTNNNPALFAVVGDSLQKCIDSSVGRATFNMHYIVNGINYFMLDCIDESNAGELNLNPNALAIDVIPQLVKLTQPQDICTSFSLSVSVTDINGNIEANNNSNYTCCLILLAFPFGEYATQYLRGILNVPSVQGVCVFSGLGISTPGDFFISIVVNIGLSRSITLPAIVDNVYSIAISTTQTTFKELEIFEVQVIMINTNLGTCIGEAVLSVFSVTTEKILSETISSDQSLIAVCISTAGDYMISVAYGSITSNSISINIQPHRVIVSISPQVNDI